MLPDKPLSKPFVELAPPNTNPETTTTIEPELTSVLSKEDTTHIKITESCDAFHNGSCVNVRSGPGLEYPVVKKLRNGIVLAVEDKVLHRDTKSAWYKISLDEHLHYPERVTTDWYVASELVTPLTVNDISSGSSYKEIHVDISEQLLITKENGKTVKQIRISTGLIDNPTPIGDFTIFRKTPSRYMQGPLVNGVRSANQTTDVPETDPEYYDLPGVPWNLYFTEDGAVIHGAYWHVNFGRPNSHGCVNVPPQNAEELYAWADVGTRVYITQ